MKNLLFQLSLQLCLEKCGDTNPQMSVAFYRHDSLSLTLEEGYTSRLLVRNRLNRTQGSDMRLG
jgi:hypothetical protein